MNQPFHRLPEHVTVSLTELSDVVEMLEDVLESLRANATGPSIADSVDEAIGRMVRWIWPLLDQLDQDDGYDE